MANRTFFPLRSPKTEVVILTAKVSIGASGAPTLSSDSSRQGLSVSRVSAGLYRFTIGKYNQVLAVHGTVGNPSSGVTAGVLRVPNNGIDAGNGQVDVVYAPDATNIAADPPNGTTLYVTIIARNSSVD